MRNADTPQAPGIAAAGTPASAAIYPPFEARSFELQLAFNLFPAAYVHRSWLAELQDDGELPQLEGTAASAPFRIRHLSAALLRHWGLDRQFDYDFFDHAKRLALPDAAELIRIGVLAGAVLMRDRIRRCVDRAAVIDLQRMIGVDAHQFALSPFAMSRDRQCGELLDVISEWSGEWPARSDAAPPIAWAAHGAALVMAAIPRTAPGVFTRLQFKFPRAWSADTAPRLSITPRQRAVLAELLIDVLTASRSEWCWLFAAAEPAPATRQGAS
ncbi:MAG: SctK family type III secretion system sorting platform protein [Steroidobacteraceae bacterium]